MNVIILGNGFDLHYSLPTTYTCFLFTVKSIQKRIKAGESISTVAQIFENPELHNCEKALQRCYNAYGKNYTANLSPATINKLCALTSANLWFTFLLNSLDVGKGWIDFEREIRKVIRALSSALESTDVGDNKNIYMRISKDDQYTTHICSCFQFFFDVREKRTCTFRGKDSYAYPIKNEFILEEPVQSGRYVVNKELIVSKLYSDLRDLSDALAIYLESFVDKPVEKIASAGIIQHDRLLQKWNWKETAVVSFNYTHTMDLLYDLEYSTLFIHGELHDDGISDIVLGIDADETDELERSDVRFIQFKKYYQRVFYHTDLGYINFLNKLERLDTTIYPVELYIIGHSLDKTDKEVIQDLFLQATEITIFFYKPKDVSDYIRNLISIFGKKQFDALRAKKNLRFHSIDELGNEFLIGDCKEFCDVFSFISQ